MHPPLVMINRTLRIIRKVAQVALEVLGRIFVDATDVLCHNGLHLHGNVTVWTLERTLITMNCLLVVVQGMLPLACVRV